MFSSKLGLMAGLVLTKQRVLPIDVQSIVKLSATNCAILGTFSRLTKLILNTGALLPHVEMEPIVDAVRLSVSKTVEYDVVEDCLVEDCVVEDSVADIKGIDVNTLVKCKIHDERRMERRLKKRMGGSEWDDRGLFKGPFDSNKPRIQRIKDGKGWG